MTRVTIQNHWNTVTKRWAIDTGDTIDMGTTAVPNLFASGVLVTAAGRDFVEILDPLAREAAPCPTCGSRVYPGECWFCDTDLPGLPDE